MGNKVVDGRLNVGDGVEILLANQGQPVVVNATEVRCPAAGGPFLEYLGVTARVPVVHQIQEVRAVGGLAYPGAVSVVTKIYRVVEVRQAILNVIIIRAGGRSAVG